MARYTLALKDGSSIQVEAPDNASDAEILQRANQQLSVQGMRQRREERGAERQARLDELYAQRPAAPEEESGFLGDLAGGFTSGLVGLGEMGALGAATLLDEQEELAARERIQSIADTLTPSIGDEGDLTYKVGQAFGSIAGAIGVGTAAVYGAGALGVGAAGAGIAGLLGAGGIGVAAGAGEASERARAAGATQEERNRATQIGALIGSTEALPLGRVFGPIASRLVGDLGEEAVQTIGQRVARAARTGGEEAAQEAASNILQNLNERGYNAEQAIFEGAGEAGAIGGGAGAAVQLLVDMFAGRRARGATPAAPEPEPLALPAPSMQVTPEGQALTEEQRAEREATLGDMPRSAVMGERRAERQPTPEELAYQRDLATIPEEEQRAQAAARDRLALAAAERGDVAEFEQPDLFALQLEQERRRRGAPTAEPQQAARPEQEPQTVRERDLVDMAEEQQRAAQQAEETAQQEADIADQIAAIEAQDQATRAASDLETITGQQETQRQQATEQGRRKILQDVIEKTPSRNYNRVSRVYEDALAKAGYKGDRAKATEAEIQSIQRAVNVQRAERPEAPKSPVAELVQLPPEATQLREMEARIPEAGTRREEGQPSLPGFGKKQDLGQAPARAAEPQAEANVVTDAMLDEMGIAPKSAVRQRLRGKDLNDPTTRQILTSFANQPRTSRAAELGISRTLEGVPAEQPDLFAPRGARRAPQTEAAPVAATARIPAPQQAAPQQLELFPETTEGVADVDTAPVEQGDRASVRGGGRGVAGPSGVGGRGADTRTPTAPEPRGLGARIASAVPAATPAGRERTTLEEGVTRRIPVPVLGRPPVYDKQTLQPVREERVGPASRALAPREKISVKSAPKVSGDQITKRLADWYDANVSAPAKRFVKELGLSITSPLTVADKTAILQQLNTKSTKANKATIGAIKKYLGAYPDPALGLQDAIDDVVSDTPNFRRTEDMTDGESEFFGNDDKNYLPARGKNAAQAVLDWASKNMSETTKRWMAGRIAESKNAKQAVEAFQSTDLVAKRRELEKAFEGGFDPNNNADNKRLADILEKLGIDETDPMVRGLLYKGGMFNMAVPPSRLPLSNVVSGLLRKGDLGAALRVLAATSSDPEVTAVASKLAKVVGNTKVEVVKSLDRGAFGRFDSDTNTIQLLDGPDLNTHVILHEMTHAATVATLANKGHPLTRKLQKIFEEAREYLPTAYGSTSLEEFVSEAFSNPQFQTQLAGLKIKGDPLTPFAKFKAAISNFLRSLIGKPVKPVESALEQTTSIIDNILAPHPGAIGNGEFFMLPPRVAGNRIADYMDAIAKASSKKVSPEFKERFAEASANFLEGKAAQVTKNLWLGLYDMVELSTLAKKRGITGADAMFKLMLKQRGAIAGSDKRVEGVLKSASSWVKANPTLIDAFNNVVYTSTIEQVDPTKPVSEYANDPDKVKAWKAMRADWRAISATGGDKLYVQMRDTYKKQYERLRDVIAGRIDSALGKDNPEAARLKKSVYERLFESGTLEPYFPLTRSGDYWLAYDLNGERVVESFDSPGARKRAIAELGRTEGAKNVEPFNSVDEKMYQKAPPTSFVGDVLRTLEANKVPVEVRNQIMRTFIETLPATSFAKSLQRRKNVLGFDRDAIGALRQRGYDLGRQAERLKFGAELQELMYEIKKNNASVTPEGKEVLDELQRRADFAANPPKEYYVQTANRVAFLYTIGFNASSAIVNLSQIPLFVMPWLGGKYGYKATASAISRAAGLVASSGFSRKIPMAAPFGTTSSLKGNAMPGLDNYFDVDANGDLVIREDLELDADQRAEVEAIKPLVAAMMDYGQINRSLWADSLGLDMSGRQGADTKTLSGRVRVAWEWANNLGAFMFHNVELFNRQVTTLAAYQLELDKLNSTVEGKNLSTAERQQKAIETALHNSQLTNGGSVLETAPRLSQKGAGRIALMYKSYGIRMYATMFKTLRQAVDNAVPNTEEGRQLRNEALRQLSGIMGTSFLLAGVVGMPLARELMQLMDLLFFDDEEDSAETRVRKAIGETWYKGPLTAALGVDLSSRIGLSGLILQANRFNHDASLEEDIFYYLGGPAWSTISRIKRGVDDMNAGEMGRAIESFLPGGISNMHKALFRYAGDGAILTRRLDPIMDDLSFGQLAAQAIGFAPAEYTRTQEMNQQTKQIDLAVNTRRTQLLRQYYLAVRTRDFSERREINARIQEFNRRHPTARIDADSIRRSMRQHMETSATMYNGITISPNMRQALKESRDEWNQGWQLF